MTAQKMYSTLDFGNSTATVTGVPTPVASTDAASKSYVDAVAQGIEYHPEVAAATNAALAAVTAAGSGVGKTLTANANGAIAAVDGYTPVANDRLVVKNTGTGVTAADFGIYTVTQVGDGTHPFILTRSTDANAGAELNGGATAYVKNGTANGNAWAIQTVQAVTIDTTSQTWTMLPAGIGTPVTIANGGTGQSTAAAAIGNSGLGNIATGPSGGTGVSSVQADGLTRKVEAQIVNPTAAGSPYLITHNLGTRAVTVQVWDTTTFQLVGVTPSVDTTNTVNIRFDATEPNTVLVVITG